MKKLFWLLFIFVPFVACDNNSGGNKVSEKDSLRMALYEKDSLLNEVFASLGTISANLEQIKSREGVITTTIGSGDLQKEPIAQIKEDILAIDELLMSNREALSRLEKSAAQLKSVNVRVAELEKLIAQMTSQLEAKDVEIATLKDELIQMNVEIEELSMQVFGLEIENADLQGEVKSQDERLNTVYYIMLSKKELVDRGILKKSGLVGRTLKISDVEALGDALVSVDKRTFDQLIVGQKGMEIITTHPKDSYTLEMDDKGVFLSLVITDREKFWEYSKVLVVSYK